MNSRTKYVIVVLFIWIALFGSCFYIAKKLFVADFEKLEYNYAIEASQRIARVVISDSADIDAINMNISYWDDSYNYIKNPNDKYIQANFPASFFKENNINEVILMNIKGDIIWSEGYDLQTKKAYPINPDVLDYFKKNAASLLENKEDYNNLSQNKDSIAGFLKLSSQSFPVFYDLNYIVDSQEHEDPNGFMIFGKTLTPKFISQMGNKLDYQFQLVELSTFATTPKRQEALQKMIQKGVSYIEPINNQLLSIYRLIKDFDFKPIGLFRIDLSRNMHLNIEKAALRNQTMLFIISLVGLLLISILIYLLFKKQEKITNSFERFVPHKFIELLNKKNILEVGLGDNLKHNIAVLFLDIRNFTTISESLTPQGNFDFVNSVLKQLSPIIVEYQGFIDKFVGDSIMALFSGESCADDAVNSAIAIQKKLDELNKTNSWILAKQEVHIGIGINVGELMIGIVGETNRLESTVIGDVVNTASRIESMTKTYEQSILISQDVYNTLKRPERYDFVDIGEVTMKGKLNHVKLYGVREK